MGLESCEICPTY